MGTWSFSGKFLLNGFVWLGLSGCSGLVIVDDCICGNEIFVVFCRILILRMASLSSPFRFNTLVFSFMLWFVITMVVFTPSESVCYTPYLNICSVLVLLDINLDGFSGGLCATVGSLSIDPEFSLIVEKLLKRALCMLDGGMSRYYLIFGSQTSVFPFVHHQNISMVLVFVESSIFGMRDQIYIIVIFIF